LSFSDVFAGDRIIRIGESKPSLIKIGNNARSMQANKERLREAYLRAKAARKKREEERIAFLQKATQEAQARRMAAQRAAEAARIKKEAEAKKEENSGWVTVRYISKKETKAETKTETKTVTETKTSGTKDTAEIDKTLLASASNDTWTVVEDVATTPKGAMEEIASLSMAESSSFCKPCLKKD